jgi:hypothetical protein
LILMIIYKKNIKPEINKIIQAKTKQKTKE